MANNTSNCETPKNNNSTQGDGIFNTLDKFTASSSPKVIIYL